MEKHNFKRTIAISSAFILAGMIVAVGSTYALFTASKNYASHIVTGNLDFSFQRTRLESVELTNDGLLSDNPVVDETVVDLSTFGTNAFDAQNSVPGCYYVATYTLENTGSTAFATTLSFTDIAVVDSEGNAANDYILDYLQITITDIDGSKLCTPFLLSSMPTDGVLLGNTLVGKTTSFVVKTEFLEDAGNDAQNVKVQYGIQLNSIQILKEQ